jgi:hypothetical protein
MDYLIMHKEDIVPVCVSICFASVIITMVAAIYFGTVSNSRQYHEQAKLCLEARGSWVPTSSGGSCIINNR